MIDKVIIAEDHETANLSIQKTMEALSIPQIDYAFYCDHALRKIQVAKQRGQPYDLLITDLYFEDDGTFQKIGGGFDLRGRQGSATRHHGPDLFCGTAASHHRHVV